MIGVQASTGFSVFGETLSNNELLVGVQATTGLAHFGEIITSNEHLVGVYATTQIATMGEMLSPNILLLGVEASADSGEISGTGFPSTRVFIIAGRSQKYLAPGVALYSTSDVVNYSADTYVIGSSPNYTIGQVSWDSAVKVQGVDWQFVAPFNHIVKILNPPALGTHIQLIYYRWNIGVPDGFTVTSYPVPFSFLNTTIIAEDVPPPGEFFTVDFVRDRPMDNPQTVFALFPLIVDDMLVNHTLYDDPTGFETYRPAGYRVLDISDMQVYAWNGSVWNLDMALPDGTLFYVKRLRGIYQRIGNATIAKFRAGDTIPNVLYPHALTYPAYGEGVGKNLMADGFSANAAVDFPASYQIAASPGDFDPWVAE